MDPGLRAAALSVLLLAGAAQASASPLLQEAYPDPWTPGEPEEYVVIANSGPSSPGEGDGPVEGEPRPATPRGRSPHSPATVADLSGWSLSDGEGGLTFPPGTSLAPGARVVVARNATAFRAVNLAWPDFEFEDSAPEVPAVAATGNFRLANDGDEIVLRSSDGTVADSLAYGRSPGAAGWVGPPVPAPPEGALLFRWSPDTDTAADWRGPRLLRAGQTRFAPEAFVLENVTLFTSPESALAETVDFLRSARQRLVAQLYEFDHRLLAQELVEAVRRGAGVDLLVEASPVGGVSNSNRALLGALEEAGVKVTLLHTPRYRFSHAKFAVADGLGVLLMTENWNAAGLPANLRGNRGWGLKAENASLAARLEEVARLDATLRPGDSRGRVDRGGPSPLLITTPPLPGPNWTLGNLTGLLVLGPESGLEEVRSLLRSARERIEVLQQTVDPTWSDGASPLLDELLRAAQRGVRVRLLHQFGDLAGFRARAEGLPVEVRAFAPHGRVQSPHAKGIIADDRVFVSSFNWNENSFSNNREAGLLLDNATAAAFFAASFDEDWQAAGAAPVPWWPFAVAAVAVLLYLRLRRRRR
ncbi:MAG: phospholipase D-like domain-containing protein [Halobacteria archaeon]